MPALTGDSPGRRSALAAWLQSHRTYPDDARRRAEEGTVLVRFSVARDGRVLEVTLVRSSGSAMPDEAGQAMFRNARMPPFTADMARTPATVTVPIRYRLEQQPSSMDRDVSSPPPALSGGCVVLRDGVDYGLW